MSDAMSFAEIDGQHAELLPARTVLSLFGMGEKGSSATGCSNSGGNSSGVVNVPLLNLLNGIQALNNCTAVVAN